MQCLDCSWVGNTVYKHSADCIQRGLCNSCHTYWGHKPDCAMLPINQLTAMIEHEINHNGVRIDHRNTPVCRFCGNYGRWEDTGPVFTAHADTCLIVKYSNYLQEWK